MLFGPLLETTKQNSDLCPYCVKEMNQITVTELAPFSMCSVCHITFFLGEQKAKLPKIFQKTESKNKLANLSKQERLEYADALAHTSKLSHAPLGPSPSIMQLLFAAVGLAVPQKGLPSLVGAKITNFLLYGMFAVTAMSLFFVTPEQWKAYIGFYRWGFFDHFGANFFLSFFAHGGLWHLAANAHYLRSFGPQVEEQLGTRLLLFMILISEVLGGLLFSLSGSDIATVGASGAITAILTYYGLSSPKEKVGVYLFYFARWIWFPVWSAMIILMIQNFIGSAMQISGPGLSEVNYLSHFSGIIVGFVFWFWRRRF